MNTLWVARVCRCGKDAIARPALRRFDRCGIGRGGVDLGFDGGAGPNIGLSPKSGAGSACDADDSAGRDPVAITPAPRS